MQKSYKQREIERYLAYCAKNNITLSDDEYRRLYTVPYTYLKRILADKMQTA